MKNITIWTIGALIVIGVAMLLSIKVQGGSPFGNNDTIKVGAALGLTGICAAWGEGELNAIQLAIEEVNGAGGIDGRKIELLSADTQCDSKGALSATKKLVEVDDVEALLGFTWGDSFQAGYAASNARKIPAIMPSGAMEALLLNNAPIEYVFSVWFPAPAETDVLAEYVGLSGAKRIAIVHDNDPYGAVYAASFRKSAEARGMTVISEDETPIGVDDFRTIITRLKASKLDGVFVSFQAPESQAKFAKQSKELGLNILVISPSDIEDASLLENFGSFLDGVVYAYPQVTGDYDNFSERYQERYGTKPQGPSAINAYDAARVLVAALSEHYEKGTDLRDAIEQTHITGTVVEQIQFDKNHTLESLEYDIKTVRNGEFVVIE